MPAYGLVDPDYRMRLSDYGPDGDGRFYMLSLTKFRPGSEPGFGRWVGRDPDDQYIPITLLKAAGAALCLVADVVAGSGDWDRVGVISYPTRRSFTELSGHRDFHDWGARKEQRVERMTMLGVLPLAELPVADPSRRVLLEIWHGQEPAPLADGPVTGFEVEGTYIGDGRRWSGMRHTLIEPGTALPLLRARFGYQAVLLQPTIEHWR